MGFPTSESSPPHAGAWSLLHVARAVSPPVAVVYNHASGAHAVCTMARIPPPSTTSADPNELFPEVQLTTVWRGVNSTQPASSVFMVQQQQGGTNEATPTLCIVDSTSATLTALTISSSSISVAAAAEIRATCTCQLAFTLPAKDAVGIRALSAPNSDETLNQPGEIVVLEPAGTIAVFVGQDRLVDVNLMLPGAAGAAVPAVVALQDAVSNRCTVELADGSLQRICLSMHAVSSPVQMCLAGLEALATRCSGSGSGVSSSNPISCTDATDLLIQLRRAYLPKWSAGASEWAAFSEACRGLLPRSGGAAASTVDISGAAALSDEASDADWEAMMQSDLHQTASSSLNFACFPATGRTAANDSTTATAASAASGGGDRGWATEKMIKCAPHVVCALHLVYEDGKLDVRQTSGVTELAKLLLEMTAALGWRAYSEHYLLDFPDLPQAAISSTVVAPMLQLGELWENAEGSPPCLHTTLMESFRKQQDMVQGGGADAVVASAGASWVQFPRLAGCGPGGSARWLSTIIVEMYSHFQKVHSGKSATEIARAIVIGLVDTGCSRHELDCLPVDVALPLREAIRLCRADPPGQWSASAYMLVGRDDLAAQTRGESSSSSSSSPSSPSSQLQASGDLDKDGMAISSDITAMRFGSDLRLREVRRILNSSRPSRVKAEQAAEVSDHDFVELQKTTLLLQIQRTMAAPVGRGIFSLHSMRPIITQTMEIPELNLGGKGPNKAAIVLEKDVLPQAALAWPQFHNGVAAGLRIAKAGQAKLSTTWIAYHRPANNELSDEHAGFLMALGLSGHLKALSMVTIHDYLTKGHETTSLGLLLGMAAAHRGTMDPGVAKMLCIHVPALLPVTSAELEVSQIVQTAAIVGVGLLYQESANHRIAEVLLNELGRRPGAIAYTTIDRESYSLAAGLALGMVVLGKGDSSPDLADLRITERLRRYIEGGPARETHTNEQSFQIDEGKLVNTDVTSSGATLALAFMFMKTHNRSVADRIKIPDTQFLLDFIRPDFLLLRVVSHSLIMWDGIQCTKEWVESKCPPVVAAYRLGTTPKPEDLENLLRQPDPETLRQAYVNITAGACMSIGLRYAGTADQVALATLMHYAKLFLKGHADVGRPTAETSLGAVVIAIGLVHAGTGNLVALRFFRQLNARCAAEISYGIHMAVHMAIGFLFMGGGTLSFGTSNADIAALVTAIFPRFPFASSDNQYHLQAFRHLYVLAASPRSIVARDVDTGEACYVPLTIQQRSTGEGEGSGGGGASGGGAGGGGAEAGLATDLITPCIVPSLDSIASIRVRGPRYWDVQLDLVKDPERANSVLRHGIVYVKRKAGQLPYAQDPKAIAALSRTSHQGLSAHGPGSAGVAATAEGKGGGSSGSGGGGNDAAAEAEVGTTGGGVRLGRSLEADEVALRFSKYLCKQSDPEMLELVHQVRTGTDGSTFRLNVLHECLIQEKPEMVATYLALEHVLTHLGSVDWLGNAVVLRGLRSFAFICAYYDGIHAAMPRNKSEGGLAPLIAPTYRSDGRECIDNALRANAVGVDAGALKAVFVASVGGGGGEVGGGEGESAVGTSAGTVALLTAIRAFYQLPTAATLRQLPADTLKAAADAAAPHDVLYQFAEALGDVCPPLAVMKVLDLLSADGGRR